MAFKHYFAVYCLIVLHCVNLAHAETGSLRLATTTSIQSSGLLEHVLSEFTQKFTYSIDKTVVGSGKALRLARTGRVDLVWVNSPISEQKFMDDGLGVDRHTVMRNDFVIAGPNHDPANISASSDIYEALEKIRTQEAPFISRADDSGTNQKELALWEKINFDPVGEDWYIETGASMATSLKIAEQEGAYIIIDRATFVMRHDNSLRILTEDPDNLFTNYSVIMVNPEKHDDINTQAASDFIKWLKSDQGISAIESFQHDNHQLYTAVK